MTSRFFDKINMIDEGIEKGPSKANYESISSVVSDDPVLVQYMFDSMTDSKWLPLLKDKVKASLDKSKHTKNISTYIAAMGYLGRIATQTPSEVISLIGTDFPSAEYGLKRYLWVLFNLPAKNLASLVTGLEQLPDTIYTSFHEVLRILLKLAKSGEKAATLKLTSLILFQVKNIPDHYLGKLFEIIRSDLAALNCTPELAKLLADKLDQVIREKHPQAEPPNDISFIWRPAIEEHSQNLTGEIEDGLVATIRELGLSELKSRDSGTKLLEDLRKRNWYVFQRLLIFLSMNGDMPLWIDFLKNKDLLFSQGLWHEYSLLIISKFDKIELPLQKQILKWCKEGPTGDLAKETISVLTRNRLSTIKPMLKGEYLEFLQKLEKKYGEATNPTFLYFSEPVRFLQFPEEEVKQPALNAESFIKQLTTQNLNPESVSGRELTNWIMSDANTFSLLAPEFHKLPPQLLLASINGFAMAASARTSFHASKVIELCFEVTRTYAPDSTIPFPNRTVDENWSYCRRKIAGLVFDIASSLEIYGNSIGETERFWKVIENLAQDPSPAADQSDDPRRNSSSAVNSTRGLAMHAAVRFVFWHSKKNDSKFTMKLEELLSEHVNSTLEPTGAIRSIFGEWLPWLAQLLPDWIDLHRDDLFEDSVYGRAVWYAYLSSNLPNQKLVSFLLSNYSKSVEALSNQDVNEQELQARTRLVEHLMIAWINGALDLTDDGLIGKFFKNANSELRKQALEYIGFRLYYREKRKDFSEKSINRIRELWEWRLSKRNESSNVELESFGMWFLSHELASSWRLSQLDNVIKANVFIESDRLVVEELAILSSEFPVESVNCLVGMAKIFSDSSEGWRIHSWAEAAEQIFVTAINSGTESRDAAIDGINLLGSLGLLELRRILPS